MKITKSQLKMIIKEEIAYTMRETNNPAPVDAENPQVEDLMSQLHMIVWGSNNDGVFSAMEDGANVGLARIWQTLQALIDEVLDKENKSRLHNFRDKLHDADQAMKQGRTGPEGTGRMGSSIFAGLLTYILGYEKAKKYPKYPKISEVKYCK
jgi:hypothetical protein